MTNKVDIPFQHFINSTNGKNVLEFLDYILNKIDTVDVIIFLTRKGYWLYRMAIWYGVLTVSNKKPLVISTDRLIEKGDIDDINKKVQKENLEIFIIDDTLSSGVTANRVYKKVKSALPNANVTPVACFLSVTNEDIKDTFKADAADMDFLNHLSYFKKATPAELGAFSYEQAKVAQLEMTPYVVDLPFLVDVSYDNSKPIKSISTSMSKEANRRFSFMPVYEFDYLCIGEENWLFYDNTYCFTGKPIKVRNGIFIYKGQELEPLLRDSVLNLVIKCRYEYMSEGEVAVIFTPFAMLESALDKDIWNVFQLIYRDWYGQIQAENDCSYYNYIKGRKEKYGMENISTNIFRSVIYFFSYYLGMAFADLLRKKYDVNLRMDNSFMNENWGKAFVRTVQSWKELELEDFQKCFKTIIPWKAVENEKVHGNNWLQPVDATEDFTELFTAVYFEVIKKKRVNQLKGCFTIEEISDYLGENFEFNSIQDKKVTLTRIFLRMLDTSIIGNRVWYGNNIIFRGFRYGENSDILLPFFNPFLFYGVDLFYRRLGWKSEQERADKFHQYVVELLDEIGDMMRDNGYMGHLVTEEELHFNKYYFGNGERENFATLIENKRFLLAGVDTSGIVFKDVASVVSYLEAFYIM